MTFNDIFLPTASALPTIAVPDYQRAYAWEEKQIKAFIEDLIEYSDKPDDYYFGHFILETSETGTAKYEVVDGQQRITTVVLFAMVCRWLEASDLHPLFQIIENFQPVSYDKEAFKNLQRNLGILFDLPREAESKNGALEPDFAQRITGEEQQTQSQHRMLRALLQLKRAFDGKNQTRILARDKIESYLNVILKSQCSQHCPAGKSAVNIFEMHNTRGIELTTIEVIKAKLMKFCYDHGGASHVGDLQDEFGKIYKMEGRLSASNFRGELSLERLFCLHCRVIENGQIKLASDFYKLPANTSGDDLVAHLDQLLDQTPVAPEEKIAYAKGLAVEFRRSVEIASEHLPFWDAEDSLVGDTLILERNLSCQFFLLACRQWNTEHQDEFLRLTPETLKLWERLLFIRDFHDKYRGLKHRDHFESIFEVIHHGESTLQEKLRSHLKDGFRDWDNRTKDLPSIVRKYWEENKDQLVNNAYYWWSHKIKYTLYKYEVSEKLNGDPSALEAIRSLVKKGISVEHILPQNWDHEWLRGSPTSFDELIENISKSINGIGNLLLLTAGENSSLGNTHPAEKTYGRYQDFGSYKWHNANRDEWNRPEKWTTLIEKRGEKIVSFMYSYFKIPKSPTTVSPDLRQ
jgi:hypothetical protein